MGDINILAVVVAGASSSLLGGLWYSPALFLLYGLILGAWH